MLFRIRSKDRMNTIKSKVYQKRKSIEEEMGFEIGKSRDGKKEGRKNDVVVEY